MKIILSIILVLSAFAIVQNKFLFQEKQLPEMLKQFSESPDNSLKYQNSSNSTNTTTNRFYTFVKKFENNHYINFINGGNDTNVTNQTYIYNINNYTVQNVFYYGSNRTYESIYTNTYRYNYSDSNKFYYVSNFVVYNLHYMTNVSRFNNSQSYNQTQYNTTVGNALVININYYSYENKHFYFNYTNSSKFIKGRELSNFRNASNETNTTVTVEKFVYVNNNIFSRHYNYSRWIPCDIRHRPYCTRAHVAHKNFTHEHHWINGSVLINKITHFYVTWAHLGVFYNSNYSSSFVDVSFQLYSNSTNDTIYYPEEQ